MAVAMVQPVQAAPAQRRALVTSVAEAKPRSILDNLVLTNKAMLGQIKEDAKGALRNPLGTLGGMLKGLLYPFTHPVEAFKGMIANIKEDPLDGLASTVGTVGSLGWFTSVLVAAVAVVAAPFTAGASLALAATAFSIGNAFFASVIVADAAGIVLHEYRGATAKSSGEAIEEGVLLAAYVEDEALNALAWAGSAAMEAKLGKLAIGKAAKASGMVFGEGLGIGGIYDLPGAHVGNALKKAAAIAAKPLSGQGR